jgi:LuxR family maltose regulon positive regulatory protein
MHPSLLTTKLIVPPTSQKLVSRPRLLEKLGEGRASKLILVSTPAGYGKSTLLSEWVSTAGIPVAWLSLDENDNNLRRFLTYLVTAFQMIDVSTDENLLPYLEAIENPASEPVINTLINEIVAFNRDFLIVLDDYHQIKSQGVNESVDFLLAHLPPNAHLVISSREDPPLALAQLRARNQMVEIRPCDLSFIQSEVFEFLNDVHGLGLSPEAVSTLLDRTEGWITGLQLAALSLNDREDKQEFIAAFSGNHRYIFDFLMNEVIDRQSEEVRSFLYLTSILDRFNASLCDEVLKISNSKSILHYLDGANFFLVPLDDQRVWYRYHHLFADFLSFGLLEHDPEIIPELHQRAAQWLEKKEFFIEAVQHALKGEKIQYAAEMIENLGVKMLVLNEFDQLETWLDAIPQDFVEGRPWLCIIQAWLHNRWNRFDIGETYLEKAEIAIEGADNSISEEEVNLIRGQIFTVKSIYTLKRGQPNKSAEYSNQALDLLPEDYFLRGMAFYCLGRTKRMQGDLSGAVQAYSDARRANIYSSHQILSQFITLDMGRIHFLQGRLHQAAENFQEVIQQKFKDWDTKLPYAGAASMGLAYVLIEWNKLGPARELITEGIKSGKSFRVMDVVAMGNAMLSLVYLAQGDLENASKEWGKAEKILFDTPDIELETKTFIVKSRAQLLLAQNKLIEAFNYLQQNGLDKDDGIDFVLEFRELVLARVLISIGRKNPNGPELTDAHRILIQILELAQPAGHVSTVIEALALQALAFDAQGELGSALRSLEQALSLAEPEGYITTFLKMGDSMKELLTCVEDNQELKGYVSKLLSAFEERERSKGEAAVPPLVNTLSEREYEVLKYLDTDLTGPEIAKELMISLSTLRSHTQKIYSKLGVHSRRTALKQAKELNLL